MLEQILKLSQQTIINITDYLHVTSEIQQLNNRHIFEMKHKNIFTIVYG